MKFISASEFNAKYIFSRFFICNLPTEFVLPCRHTGNMFNPFERMNRVYAYHLPPRDFPYKIVKTSNSERWISQVAIEVWEDYGDDGHTKYSFRNKFILVYEDELPKDFLTYQDLLSKLYNEEREFEEKNKQLDFSSYCYNWFYSRYY